MAVFVAKVANLIGWGEQSTKRTTKKRKEWARDKYQVRLDGHIVTIKQRKRALTPNRNAIRGRYIESSTIRVSHIKSFQEGNEFVEDLCWLLSFATQSRVVAYQLRFENRKIVHSVMGSYNSWRPPFGNGVGSLTDFLIQAWPNYQRLKLTRPLSSFIHMIDASDLSGRVLESQISFSMQCLEAVKTYYAIDEGNRHDITEDRQGRFRYPSGSEAHFEDLLEKTLAAVGMRLPRSFDRIKKLRNALIHRGFIRETDAVTRYIFGALSSGVLHNAMFKVMEDTQDILREYMLRLLGYKGSFWTYSHEGSLTKNIT